MKEKFPYEGFPFRLEYKEDKVKKICYFECSEHLMKHVNRYNLTDFIAEHLLEGEIEFKSPKSKKKTKTKPKPKVSFSSLDKFFK